MPVEERLRRRPGDYLKTIYLLQQERRAVSAGDLSRELGVTPASVTGMVQRLCREGLTEHDPYQAITLTSTGEKAALEMIRHHRLLEEFLHRTLGYRLAEVHEEAERLEHAISENLEERMDLFLGRPAFDPHGSPIPDAAGGVRKRELVSADSLEPGQAAVVGQLTCRSPAQLKHLEGIGLVPGAEIRLEAKDAGGGIVRLRIGSRRDVPIGDLLARQVLVSPA
jgi:DtxR family Mn-dependent transcriptional regulator